MPSLNSAPSRSIVSHAHTSRRLRATVRVTRVLYASHAKLHVEAAPSKRRTHFKIRATTNPYCATFAARAVVFALDADCSEKECSARGHPPWCLSVCPLHKIRLVAPLNRINHECEEAHIHTSGFGTLLPRANAAACPAAGTLSGFIAFAEGRHGWVGYLLG